MSRLTLARFCEIAGGTFVRPAVASSTSAALATTSVALERSSSPDQIPFIPSTDSRTLRRGQTFVALRGPNFDGHRFIGAALGAGAAALVVDDAGAITRGVDVPTILVADAKHAYLAGAAAARRLYRALVVGITGSNGKTTTKTMAAQLIGRFRRVVATPANENNELGVAKLCYALDDSVDVAIAEFGARHPGEIEQLVQVAAPDVAVLTNIGEAHLEFFRDIDELARTKFAIFSGGARAVCNAADAWTRRLADENGMGKRAMWARLCGEPEAPGLSIEAGEPQGGRVAVSLGASHAFASWHLIGEHHLKDALLAAGAALQCGLRFEEAIAGFADLRLPPGRFELHALPGGATAVYDAYNASPTSMQHALRAFAALSGRCHIAVLGSMAELGSGAVSGHEATGAAAAAARVDALYCGGDHAQTLARGALDAGMPPTTVHTYVTNAEIAQTLRDVLRPDDVVLLKGSRVQRMEEILNALLATASPAGSAGASPRGESSEDLGFAAPSAALAASEGSAFGTTRRRGIAEAQALPARETAAKTFTVQVAGLLGRIVALPVRTPLVRAGDDLARVITDAIRGIASPEDVVCVSETAVAIAQGRSIRAEAIRPGRLARMLAERAGSYATMAQPESVQLVIEQVGTARVLAAAVAGVAGRMVGRSGDFYRVLGPAVAEIDGYTGTMPPYERHIVFGPHDPEAVAKALADACGAHVAILDANDLHKVDVLGASERVNREVVRECLVSNPHGNSDQQTPIVVLKYRPTKGGPSLSPLLTC